MAIQQCNQGIKKSAGKFILLLNPDTVVEEDTFRKCIEFMIRNSNAGALGVRMTDSEGNFLPESKRAFPYPLTALFKITCLGHLFPRSKLLNRYYQPGIGIHETSQSEVISGAFMFIRRTALEKAGLLDEDFFMYGEDIDLSYRIINSGFRNYYFPEVNIVHYKGRSTDRRGFSDIIHFYRAMRIYSGKRQKERFSFLYYLIIPAIYFIEMLALSRRFLRIIFER